MRTKEEILKGSGWSYRDFDCFLFECSLSYPYFAHHVLGFNVADFHEEWFILCEKFKRVCVMAHRGSGKTFWFAGYLMWKALFNENKEFLIVGNNLEHSKYILKVVKNLIQENEVLRQMAPENRDQSWRQTEISTKNNCTFYVRTYSENISGLHPDWIFCDEAGLYDDKTIFWQVISPTVQIKNGRIIVAGTPKSYADLLMELYNENDEYMSKKYPAIVKEGDKDVPLWKAKYCLTEEDYFGKASILKIRREMGELNFEQEYMLRPVSSQTSLFPYELINANISPHMKFKEIADPNKRYVIGVDLAFSKAVKGDFTVFTVLEIEPDRSKSIVYIDRIKGMSPSRQKEILKEIIGRFHPHRVGIDQKGVGEVFLKDLQEEIPSVSIEGISYNRPDEKQELLNGLRTEFENNRLIIPHDKEHSKTYSMTSILIKELEETGWKIRAGKARVEGLGMHDDTVMSLAIANKAGLMGSGKVGVYTL